MYVAPELDKEAFTCPHCHVYTTMTWADLTVPTPPGNAPDPAHRRSLGRGRSTPLSQATCYHCQEISYWFEERMIVPTSVNAPMPSADLPEALRTDFMEAREIVNASPRGAAALLRLVIQKLMVELGEEGEDINTDIGELVKKGRINARTQRSLDSVRVIGNEAVHPGTLNVRDDPSLAQSLFYLVNLIVYEALSVDKTIDSVYDRLPINKRKGIEDRDNHKPSKQRPGGAGGDA